MVIDCSYKGECQMMGCINANDCFIKELFEDRYLAEKELYRKERECERYAKINEQETKDYADLLKQLDQLKQTLAEIKEIAEDTKDKFYDAIHTGGLYDRLEQIIRKINEVDNDRT